MEFLYKISAIDANIERATLWIPKTDLTTNVHRLGKRILEEYKPTGWRFWIHIYNAIDFGEHLEELQYEIHSCW